MAIPTAMKDLKGTELVDKYAKRAVDAHRVPKLVVDKWGEDISNAKRRIIWMAKATVAMNNSDEFLFKDSEAARWRSEAAAERRKAKKLRSGPRSSEAVKVVALARRSLPESDSPGRRPLGAMTCSRQPWDAGWVGGALSAKQPRRQGRS